MKKNLTYFVFFLSILLSSCISNNEIFSNLKNEKLVQTDNVTNTIKNENNDFTFVVIPDTQSYLDYRCQKGVFKDFPINQYELYYRQMQYIADNSVKNGGNLDFAIHVGDLVDHRKWNKTEWQRARQGFDIINNQIPFITVMGNHDYDNWDSNKAPYGTKCYTTYFGPQTSLYNDKEWFGGSTEDGINSWCLFSKDKVQILIIGLEFNPSDKEIEWTQNVIDKNYGIPTIIVTHSYLSEKKDPLDNSQNALTTAARYKNIKRNSASELFDKLISPNNQIFLILCGHCASGDLKEGLRIDENEYNNKVIAILTDFQNVNETLKSTGYESKTHYGCGDGWLRFLNFNLDKKELHVQTYSTEYNKYATDKETDYILKLDWNWKERFPGLYK